ncbi:hypothetical protein GTQ34_07200 [Muricauda sp. JGD-17]|uniref:Alpha/beta hydrolase n=1 Tax=Flagellimonas ochracea TaxID=2696472 RepID=A0A964TCW6_9FLAO|nr:hypothetical protein [Allomuricauda ochracea]NAY91698.1 hypothetical protein [Allomuricauda ochracea]
MRPFFLLLCACFAVVTLVNAQSNYEKGKIIDSIAVSQAQNETFSLYLPESFMSETPQPILYIYEPMGRGTIGVQPFIAASEKYGLILVCSNNSKNGPYDQNFAIANNLFNHVFSNFNIKDDEMFAAGFSGGSRLASAIASLTNKFSGVIGCGAGFSGLQEHMPSTQNYAYVGLCGNRDMNYREMLENKAYLNLINFNSALITYDDNHSWPPSGQILRAFDWLYLQRTKNSPPVQIDAVLSFYKTDYNLLQQFLDNKKWLFAAEQYERIIKDYKDHIQVDSLETKYHLFKNSKHYKKSVAALNRALNIEEKFSSKFRSRFSQEFENSNTFNYNWWEKELGKLEVLAEKEGDEIKKMAARVKYDLFARAFVRKNGIMQSSNTAQVASLNQLLQLVYPNFK